MMTANWQYAEAFGTLVMPSWEDKPEVTTVAGNEFAAEGVVRIIENTKPFCAAADRPAEYVLLETLADGPLTLTNAVIESEPEDGVIN